MPFIVGLDIGCGMRVHTTQLHKRDIQDKAVRPGADRCNRKVYADRERVNSNYEDIDIMAVVQHGLKGLPDNYVPGPQWLTHVEQANFGYDHAYLEQLPPK